MMNFLRCLGLVVLCSTVAQAASPILGGISPRGVQKGADTILLFGGSRLSDVKEIIFHSPGFTVAKLEAVNDSQVKATVKVAANVLMGEHSARIRTASGLSELRTFWVGPYPVVAEKEPNSDFATPQKITLGVTVTGVVDYEDVDYFSVDLKKGQRLSVEIEAMRLANTLFDPYIAILDSKRFELATSDDHPLLGQDGMCSIVAPADGTYVIQVRESAYQGNGACQYRLHVGSFPRPTAVVPAGGKAGEEIEVRFLGDPAGEFRQKVKIPNQVGAKFGLYPEDANGVAPSAIPFRISDVGNTVEVEPNDTVATATKATFPSAFNGVIDKPGDVDHFRFTAKKGQTFDIHCFARRLGSPLDSVMTLYNGAGTGLTSNDDAIGPDSYFRYTFPADGEYVIGVTDHLGKGGPTYFYRIEFNEVKATATITIPKVALYSQERQVISIPKGGRMATLLSVGRGNFGGDVILSADNLPAGVSLAMETVPANLDTVPAVFEATPTAALAGSLAHLHVRHLDPKNGPIQSTYQGQAELIVGAPGQSIYWKHTVDKLAFAVTEESFFTIDIVEPKAPLVQNGSMQLKIVAKRSPTFKGAITILPLFNPPGVSSASSATIAPNATETTLTLNAASNAQNKKWKTAVLGVADAGKGPLWTSSQLATVEVASPFLSVTMERAAVEQGKPTAIFCKIGQLVPFEGKAKVRLLGLPVKVMTKDAEITKDTKEISFELTTDKTSPAGTHRNLFCEVSLIRNGEPVVAGSGYSELRIDVPIVKATPPPVVTPTPVVKPVVPVPTTPPKRLTRLELLRKEQEEREKAGTTPPAPKK